MAPVLLLYHGACSAKDIRGFHELLQMPATMSETGAATALAHCPFVWCRPYFVPPRGAHVRLLSPGTALSRSLRSTGPRFRAQVVAFPRAPPGKPPLTSTLG